MQCAGPWRCRHDSLPSCQIEVLYGSGFGEVITLCLGCTHLAQQLQGGQVLYPFGHHGQTQRLGHAHDGTDDGTTARTAGQLENERLVDLQAIELVLMHVAERRETGTEVVQHDAHAVLGQLLHGALGHGRLGHQRTLGQFQADP